VGKPTHALLVHDDGSEEAVPDVAAGIGRDWATENERGQLELLYDYRPELLPSGQWHGDGMWRYRDLLPLDDRPISYPLPVGGTPLIAPPAVRDELGLPNLWLKDETRGPSASNKDRATALILQQAMTSGTRRVTCASTGNVAVSLAVGAAAAGKEAVTFVAADVAASKLRLMLQSGATVVKVEGGYEAAFRLSRAAAREFGWIDRNTGVNPATVEAKKTAALEIWEQLGREVPDVVVVPVGDGPTLHGMAKGFREIVACGASQRVPRLVGVQAEGCQPIKHAWETGERVRPAISATIADGIAVSRPVSGAAAVRDVVRSGGCFVSVSDTQMLDAMRILATRGGVLAEPAAAAALAGLLVALERRLVGAGERIVVLVTGSSLKTPEFLRAHGRVIEVDGDLDALRESLG
jgi:threonine synthase